MFNLSSLANQPPKQVDRALRDRFLELQCLDDSPDDADRRPGILDTHEGSTRLQVTFDKIDTWGSPHLTQRTEENGQVTYTEITKPRFSWASAFSVSQGNPPVTDGYFKKTDTASLEYNHAEGRYDLDKGSGGSSNDTTFGQHDWLFRYEVGMPLPED